MNPKLMEKLKESFVSVLPITLIVMVISVVITPISLGTMSMFIVGAIFLIIGMGVFQLGVDISMTPLGEGFGAQLSMTKKIGIVSVISLLMGIIVTAAEPDLAVLASQVPAISKMALIMTISIGVGVFLVIAVLRVIFKVSLNIILLGFYLLLFVVSLFTQVDYLAIGFDSGGVTTGPITVPFIMAMGVGLASLRSDKDASSDSFGLVALCSVGPILAVLILGIFSKTDNVSYSSVVIAQVDTTADLVKEFAAGIPLHSKEVLIAVLPIAAVFAIFQIVTRRYKKRQILRMSIGFIYTFVGLVLFFTGVNSGFVAVGHLIGSGIAQSGYSWLLIPLGMLSGYFIVVAEPAVHILNKQVEDITNGSISHKSMNLCLSIGVAASVGLSMVRVLTGISIYWILVPGYAIALILSFIVPKLFVGIAFDSGGVASGPMATTFLLPFALGASEAIGGNVMRDAFGIVAFVAMTPLIAIQIMGVNYTLKLRKAQKTAVSTPLEHSIPIEDVNEIIDYSDETENDSGDNDSTGVNASEHPKIKSKEENPNE